MPIDGSFGRLRAHKQRLEELKYKKRERKENINKTLRLKATEGLSNKEHDPKKVALIKKRISEEATIRRRKEKYAFVVFAIISLIGVYFFFKWLRIL